MTSLQSNIKELESIKTEIKRNNDKNKKLRARQKILEQDIKNYLESKDQEGLKFKDKNFVLEHTTSFLRRKKADKEQETKRLLRNSGIGDIDTVYKKLTEIQKGKEVETTKLKVKKTKNKL